MMETQTQLRTELECCEKWINEDDFEFLKDLWIRTRSVILKDLLELQIREFDKNN